VEGAEIKRAAFYLSILIGFLWTGVAMCQQSRDSLEIPSRFQVDQQTAASLRPQLEAQSVPAAGPYITGSTVFAGLVAQVEPGLRAGFTWTLRVVENGEFNAYSSPEGSIYVESGLARLAGTNPGLWAAVLSHEIAHVERRDWARRYLYQKQLEDSHGGDLVLGEARAPAASWIDPENASADMGRFCRQLELDADREGLMLMAHAGYHPDFAPALHHLLRAEESGSGTASARAMHPCWEERDRALSRTYVEASIEFEHLWPDWFASPGGNHPVVVFTDPPTFRKTETEWQILLPMRCENLAGAVEVVLHAESGSEGMGRERRRDAQGRRSRMHSAIHLEMRQVTGCMPPKTTVVFHLAHLGEKPNDAIHWTDVSVFDAWGAVLARADLARIEH